MKRHAFLAFLLVANLGYAQQTSTMGTSTKEQPKKSTAQPAAQICLQIF